MPRVPFPTPFTLEANTLIVQGRRLKMKGTDFVAQIVRPLVDQGYEALTVQSTYRIINPTYTILDDHQKRLLCANGVPLIVTVFAERKQGGRQRKAHLGTVKRLLQQGWSQSAIAQRLGVTRPAISHARNKLLLNAAKKGETVILPKRGKSVMRELPRKRV